MLGWSSSLGYGVFSVAVVVAIILYAMKRKWYPVMYLVSLSLYIFTIGFIIDKFNLSKNWILLLLGLSAVIMIVLGYYLSKQFHQK